MTVDELLAQYPDKMVSQIVNDMRGVTDRLPMQFHAALFDMMTVNGYKLDLLTGNYEYRVK